MRKELFKSNAPGRLVRVGLPGLEHAFVPDPLPPSWEWPTNLWPLLSQARAALARLDGIGSYLPDPEVLLRPLQHREAQTSSRLEGTFAKPEQVLLLELEPGDSGTDDAPTNVSREVFNYARALRLPQTESLPLSLRLVRRLHAVLLEGVRGQDRQPGEFRGHPVQIGRPARFVPPPPEELAGCLDAFEKYLHARRTFDPLVEAFLVHYQFEAIHPFLDGNGRVGRLLLTMCIAEWCGLSKPWLHLSPYFERHKDAYFDGLFRVSAEADWASWVRFCLEGVVEQSNDAAGRCRRLLDLRKAYTERAHGLGGSVRLVRVIDALFATPVVSIAGHARSCAVTYPTAKSDLEKLVRVGVLAELSEVRKRTFYAPAVVEIIFGDEASGETIGVQE